MQWLSDQLNKLGQWLQEYLLYVPKWCWQHLLEALQALVNAIPVPDAFGGFSSAIGNVPPGVVWFLDLVQFKFGVGVIGAAYLARFILRRIPLIG